MLNIIPALIARLRHMAAVAASFILIECILIPWLIPVSVCFRLYRNYIHRKIARKAPRAKIMDAMDAVWTQVLFIFVYRSPVIPRYIC